MSNLLLTNYDGIIGFNKIASMSIPWFATDTEDNYKRHCLKLKNKNVWKDIEIQYLFNKLGHRTHLDPSKLEDNNYILAVGCSHTQGVGLPINLTYWNHLPFDVPVYNMGISGAGNDLIYSNIANWLRVFTKNRPKMIICQRTEINRFTLWNTLEKVGSWFQDAKGINLLVAGDQLNYWDGLGNQFRNLVLDIVSLNNIPIVEFGIDFSFRPILNPVCKTFRWKELDYARDYTHGGPASHSAFADWIKNEFKDVLYS